MNKFKKLLIDVLSTITSMFICLILVNVADWKGAILWAVNCLLLCLYFADSELE